MSEDAQRTLSSLWTQAPDGHLTPWSQAKAWALNEVWSELHKDKLYGRNEWIAQRLYVKGPGKKHPTNAAISQFLKKVADDPDWFPGKIGGSGSLGGRPPVLSQTNQRAIARSSMALKERGVEPTYPLIIAQCPNAARNPHTGEPVCKHVVYDILERLCYDVHPDCPWTHLPRASKTALTPGDMEKRLKFGKYMEGLKHSAAWYSRHVVWTDVCNDVLPKTEKKATQQALARKGGSGWMSPGCQTLPCNLRGKKEDLKLCGSECVRVFWMPILARGKFHLELLGSAFPGDNTLGMAMFVRRLRAAINARFRDEQPDIVFVDRGGGFYDGTGKITAEYQAALRENDFKAFHGPEASIQPGRSGDLWLHETTVSWTRERLKRTLPPDPWQEPEEAFGKRLKLAAEYVNKNYDVASLCAEMPERMRVLVHEKKGGKLRK